MRPFGKTILKHKMLLEGLANKYHGILIPVSTAIEVASRAMYFQTAYDFESCLAVMQEAFNVNEGYFVDSAGATSVERSRWIKTADGAECENCGREAAYQIVDDHWEYEPWCPHCGARMDAQREE